MVGFINYMFVIFMDLNLSFCVEHLEEFKIERHLVGLFSRSTYIDLGSTMKFSAMLICIP